LAKKQAEERVAEASLIKVQPVPFSKPLVDKSKIIIEESSIEMKIEMK